MDFKLKFKTCPKCKLSFPINSFSIITVTINGVPKKISVCNYCLKKMKENFKRV